MSKIKKILIIIFSVIILPAISILVVGCGATAVNQIKGVSFVSTMRNEQGEALFEIDLDSPVKLPYKINPSSAYGYTPMFTPVQGISGVDKETYTLDPFTGEMLIYDERFISAKVEITVGSYKDICQIKLKTYPNKIGIYDENAEDFINMQPEINLACETAYQINVAGQITYKERQDEELIIKETKTSLLKDSDYNFLVEVDEQSKELINVTDSHRLNIFTTKNYGTAKLKVTICDYYNNVYKDKDGNTLSFDIIINVYPECEYMDVYLKGAEKIYSSKNEVNNAEIRADDILVGDDYILTYKVDLYSKNIKIEDESLQLTCTANHLTYVDIDNEKQEIKITKPAGVKKYNFTLRIRSNARMENNEFCTIAINITIKF